MPCSLSGYVGFLAPDKIDSKFFDPKHAFKEVEVQAKTVKELIPIKKPKVCLCVCMRIDADVCIQ